MNKFTDDDLRRLKEHPDYLECSCISPEKHERQGGSYPKLVALLVRLEAAEKFLNFIDDSSTIHWDANKGNKGMRLWETWRKAAGK